MAYVIPVPSIPALPVAGTDDLFPVRRVYCVGRNYAAHAREMGADMTRRDLQDEAKQLRRPWELGKAADLSGPVGPLHPASDIGHPASGSITLSVDGAAKQKGDLSDMIWSVAEQVAYLSSYFELFPGDVIFSGTPEGVGAVTQGQTLSAAIEGLGEIRLRVV